MALHDLINRQTSQIRRCHERSLDIQQSINDHYAQLTHFIMRTKQRPIILVDWSDMDAYKRHFLIWASASFEGRSITLYEEVHTINTKEKPATHRSFLKTLKSMLASLLLSLMLALKYRGSNK